MSIVQFSLDPSLHTSQFYNLDLNDRTQDFIHFEPIHITSQHNKYYNYKKQIKLSPTINYDNNNNSLMYYQIQIQKMRVKRARQQRSSKYQRLPDLDCNSYLGIIQPTSKTLKITQRKYSQPQRLPTNSFCHLSNDNEYQSNIQTKIKIRLPIIEKNQVNSSCRSSLNCWTRNNSYSLLYENQ
ncbi:unnamed protein product [Paramecium sonneborni]|uniref:Uncharacterized protein n=1 Tax=Paramecium sonneborni TaxID=65129 RepID=A0A8S1LRL8_9CILI|nr:unnamed protein product [Paramecium sonneborni]